MTSRALPILENMEYITARVKSITENIDDQVMIVRESIASVREIADNVVALERKVQDRIEGPILDGVAFFPLSSTAFEHSSPRPRLSGSATLRTGLAVPASGAGHVLCCLLCATH